ncbi:winged helix DNA-binding domain-containing protein [Antribacter gilvus]|uniref:winged helix DNA-binding domain-containing protein n=1 Tax=Antribacter gilvus TaxID=2304675 RepID=UPI000F799192|nr:winged helix DNA-binding domain-containing protein [Antribacter gilvus]
MEGLDGATLLGARLWRQHLRGPGLPGPTDVVRALGAVQGQEFRPALWGLAQRCATRPGESALRRLFDDGAILRTHVLRPTWHLLAPDDARWILTLSAPRVHRANGTMYRRFDVADVTRATDVVAELVADGPRTRPELAEGLAARGIDTSTRPAPPGTVGPGPGIAVTLLLMRAELDRVVISGPLNGRQHTYAAFDARVPEGFGPLGPTYDEEAAVAELVRRYLATRAAATVKDLGAWSGLTLSQVRSGLALLSDDVAALPGAGDLEGLTFWHLRDCDPREPVPPGTGVRLDLLQAYDELFMSYTESRGVVVDPAAAAASRAGAYVHAVVVDGLVTGRWRWPPAAAALPDLDVQWLREPGPGVADALGKTLEELGDHLAG